MYINPPPKDLHTYVVGEMADKAEYLFTGDECQVKAAHSDSGWYKSVVNKAVSIESALDI